MKKILIAVTCILLSGCVRWNVWNPPKVEEIDPVELIGVQGKPLSGRLWRSTCQSNAFGNADTAKQKALENMAEKAYEQGYKYFCLLDTEKSVQDNLGSFTTNNTSTSFSTIGLNSSNGTSVRGNVWTTASTPQTNYFSTRFHTFSGIFLLLKEDDVDKAPNVYTVEKYYKPLW